MLKTIIIDKNNNSKDLISSYLNEMEEISLIGAFGDFSQFEVELSNIDLIIFDIDSNTFSEKIKKIRAIKEKNKNINFIALSYEINSELVSKVLKEDIKDFLLKPILPNILQASVKKIESSKNQVTQSDANTICIYSPKAASGKTSLALNLAYQLSRETKDKVCLLDLNFKTADIEAFLGVEAKNSFIETINSIEKKDEKGTLALAQKYQDSLYVLSFRESDFNFRIKPQDVQKLINILKNIFQYIIIDTNSEMDETTVSILNNSDIILFITMLNLVSIRNSQKCYQMFEQLGYSKSKVKLIVNRYIENSEISLQDGAKTIGREVFATIPNNYLTLVDAINLGRTVIETNPQSNIAKAYKEICAKILNIDFLNLKDSKNPTYNHGIFNLLRRMGE